MKFLISVFVIFFASCNLLNSDSPQSKDMARSDMGDSADLPPDSETCFDSVKNGNETDLNCGGDCRPCTDNLSCIIDGDCSSGICSAKICSVPKCGDGVRNGTESDLDCGGNCDACEIGLACEAAKDCQSGICTDSKCLDVCDSQCGGDCLQKCGAGRTCENSSDCDENLWCDGICKIVPTGWQQTIKFNATANSEKFNAYVRIPEFVEADADKIIFSQEGQLLVSERAEETGAFWVHLPKAVIGENVFQANVDERLVLADGKMWSDHIAVFHTPGLAPVISDNIAVMDEVNVQMTPGIFGNASFFDGTAYVSAIGAGIESFFPAYSISVWVRPDVMNSDWKPIFGRQLGTTISDDLVLAGSHDGKFYSCSSGVCAISQDPVPIGEWTFISATFEGMIMKLYVNGELDSEKTGMRIQSLAGNPLTIGGDANDAVGTIDEFYIGSIDELRFSSEVQTAESVRLQFLSVDPAFFTFGEKTALTK